MPELPEVETTRRGIALHICGELIEKITVRQPSLRWQVPADLARKLKNQRLRDITRRGKYLLFHTDNGHLISHLGMSGSMRILPKFKAPDKHDHIDICFANKKVLRFTDPRRFGCMLWTADDPLQHKLLKSLGPEPLDAKFNGKHLHTTGHKRKIAVKSFIMDSKVVVGVGNIYAAEALFAAGIDPRRAAGNISLERYQLLAKHIKRILRAAIKQGGTTLKDFSQSDGKPGYFKQKLKVYGRADSACINCKSNLELIQLGQRATVFCPTCQS